MNRGFEFNEKLLDEHIATYKQRLKFFEDFFAKNEGFVPEARNFIGVIQDQLIGMRRIDNIVLAEDIFHKGSVLVPTLGHVLRGILTMELWGSKAQCEQNNPESQSCDTVKQIVQTNMGEPLHLFPNRSDCLYTPEGAKCSGEWRNAQSTLQQKYNSFVAEYRYVIRVQLKRYLMNHKPVAKEELGTKYNSRVVESKMTQVVENIMKNVQRRNTEFMSQLLPLLDRPKTQEMKKSLEREGDKLKQMEIDITKRIDQVLTDLASRQDQRLHQIATRWRNQEVDMSNYFGDYTEADMEAYKAEQRRKEYGVGGPSPSEISQMIDDKIDSIWENLDNLYMRVDTIQSLVNERLISFAEMIDNIAEDLSLEAQQWKLEKENLQGQITVLRREENDANMALTQTMEMMQGDNRKRLMELQQEQQEVEREIAQLRSQQELQGNVLDIVAEDFLNQSRSRAANEAENRERDRTLNILVERQQFLLSEIQNEKARVSRKLEVNEIQIDELRKRMRSLETRVSQGETNIASTQEQVVKLKRSLLRNQAFLWFLTIMGILAYLWYNWEEKTSSMPAVSFFTDVKNAALGPLRRMAVKDAMNKGDYYYPS